ncbi:MAG: gramicidin dehydrogenase [Desulfosporosinus sp. BRH_c37]|nr:MAG: gramicidin dehydrogenase [Desulfosporosinus sp. BRH_c37]
MKLFCLPYAGGSKQAYASWKKYAGENFAQQIEIEGIEIKGRGERFGAGFYHDFAEALDDVYSLIKDKIQKEDYALYGHSMGAVLAYELYYKIAAAGRNMPGHIFFTGRYSPLVQDNMYVSSDLPDAEFIRRLLALGGIPEKLPESRELLEFYLPIIKNDIRVLETYVFREREDKIKCGITVINGWEDRIDIRREITWRDLCSGEYRSYYLNGGHFFINHSRDKILEIMAERLFKEDREGAGQE